MTNNVLESIKSVEVLSLKPGDYLICELDTPINSDGRKNLREQLASAFGDDIEAKQIIVLMPGMKLSVARKEAVENAS